LFQKIRELSKDLAIYGVGDVAVSVVNFLLLPLYVRYLTPGDYGVLGVLGSVEVVAKVFFRWGLDGSFMRLFYECDTPASRQRLASTIFLFLLAVNGG
jgi:O-antigen/teichoic acid export membrane protein